MAFLISRCFNRVRQEVEYESLRQIFSVWSCYPDGSVSLRDFLWLDLLDWVESHGKMVDMVCHDNNHLTSFNMFGL
jgi:hypothetical protein